MTDKQLAERLGTRIKKARESFGKKQKDVAKAIGIGSSFLCEIEKGKAFPNLPLLYKIELEVGKVWWCL